MGNLISIWNAWTEKYSWLKNNKFWYQTEDYGNICKKINNFYKN